MRALLVPSLILTLSSVAAAQCQTASVTSYDATPPNPIHLTTEFPFEYPVVGSSIRLRATNTTPGSINILMCSLGAAQVAAGPPIVGSILLANPQKLVAPQVQPEWTLPVFPQYLGDVVQVQAFSFDGTAYLASNGLELNVGFYQAEIEVLSVSPDGTPISGSPGHPYSVTFRNNGNAPATPTLQVCVGGICNSASFPIDPGQTLTRTVFVNTPGVGFSCGGGATVPLSACSLLPDCDPTNDCVFTSTWVDSAYWDLRFEIQSEPSSVHVGQAASWKVKVTNTGNVPSDNVCFINAINLTSGSGGFGSAICGNVQQLFTGVLAPGASKTFNVSQFVCFGSFLGTQWIKTEIHYSAGCFDNCSAGNFDQESIQILP